MALQTFTAGQVLTAAQVNALQANDYNQTVSTKTDSYTLVAADKGTRVEMNKATATTITVNTDLFNAGDTLFIQNRGAGICTITAGTATVSTAGSLALAQYQGGTLYFISTGVAIFFLVGSSGFSALKDASVSGTTGSPTTTTYTSGGKDYKAYKFTGSGSITFTKDGLVDVLVVAGGGGATGNVGWGAGAGGRIRRDNVFVTAASQTVTIGAGGAGGATRGGQSSIADLTAVGGGINRHNVVDLQAFGGSSGSGNGGSLAGQNVAGQGNIGFVGGTGGGGGAGGAGGATAGGVGVADSITGTSVTLSAGGSSSGGAGGANTGNGAGGSGANAGGSGVVVVRVLQ
jgi:hypothetical protein